VRYANFEIQASPDDNRYFPAILELAGNLLPMPYIVTRES
jgi:hypothetical protein